MTDAPDQRRFSIFIEGRGIKPVDRKPVALARITVKADDHADAPRVEVTIRKQHDGSLRVVLARYQGTDMDVSRGITLPAPEREAVYDEQSTGE